MWSKEAKAPRQESIPRTAPLNSPRGSTRKGTKGGPPDLTPHHPFLLDHPAQTTSIPSPSLPQPRLPLFLLYGHFLPGTPTRAVGDHTSPRGLDTHLTWQAARSSRRCPGAVSHSYELNPRTAHCSVPTKGAGPGWGGLGNQDLPEALPPAPLPLCLLAPGWRSPSHTLPR